MSKQSKAWCSILLVSGVAATGAAAAQSDEQGWLDGMSFSFGGFVRAEAAFSTGDENPNNQRGNPFNGVPVRRQAGDPLLRFNGPLPIGDTYARTLPESDNDWNYHVLRAEGEFGINFSSKLKLVSRVRGIYDPGHYSEFDARSVADDRDGITGGDPALYHGDPNYFEYRVEGDSSPNPLEWAGPSYMVDLPSLFLDYNSGPLNLRLGNQQIAWGQAIFFRVLDVPDGLDLRRHSVLDNAQEEFSDKRVPSLGLRVGYQLTDAVLLDGYVHKFQPTIFGNPNTAYNVIPAQFTVHDLYAEGGYDNKLSYGLRMKADYGQWGFQAIAARRYNPDGVFRWTASGVDKNLPNNNALGILENTLHTGLAGTQTTGELLAQTPFEASPTGVVSADEWFHYAASVRLNGITGLNSAVTEFQPATGNLLATTVDNFDAAHRELDTFFIAGGDGLRGHIAREYFQEDNFGGGVSYVTEGEPGTWLDQLIINVEATYTPERTFTNPSLSRDYLRQSNWIGALVLEKWARFSQDFPGTYLVFQYMYRENDDLFGRSLEGYGGTDHSVATGVSHGAHYIAVAFQQPFPAQIVRIDFAMLVDPRGGILVQPGVRYRPNGPVTIEAFYSYINGDLGHNPNDNALSTADFADELSVRLAYQF